MPCIFAAWVANSPAANDGNVQRVQTEPGCEVQATVDLGQLILVHNGERVEIDLPSDREWHRLKYEFGRPVADIEKWVWVPVKKGPEGYQ